MGRRKEEKRYKRGESKRMRMRRVGAEETKRGSLEISAFSLTNTTSNGGGEESHSTKTNYFLHPFV